VHLARRLRLKFATKGNNRTQKKEEGKEIFQTKKIGGNEMKIGLEKKVKR